MRIRLYYEESNSKCLIDTTDVFYFESRYLSMNKDATYISGDVEAEIDSYKLNYSFTPQEQDEIYMFPNSKYSSNDIRKHYKIKKTPDAGVCNVVPTCKTTGWYSIKCAYNKKSNKLILSEYWVDKLDPQNLHKTLTSVVFAGDPNFVYIEDDWLCFTSGLVKVNPIYLDLIDGKFTKPCIPEENLKVVNTNPVTSDLLKMIFTLGKGDWGKANVTALTTQLMSLNQCDWQNYPGTIHVLFKNLLRYSSCLSEASRSGLKPIKNLMEHSSYTKSDSTWSVIYKDKADFDMAKTLLCDILNIHDKMFVSYEKLAEKLMENNLDISTVDLFFKPIVKLQPVEYEEEKGNSAV